MDMPPSSTRSLDAAGDFPVSFEDDFPALPYVAPQVVDLGPVKRQTKGSSGSGTADANSQYYWG